MQKAGTIIQERLKLVVTYAVGAHYMLKRGQVSEPVDC
ncbi:hypothetical protein BC777_1518 [Yoonia maricola]|uniref:Uncharacterized protein n=1 Tax=Yoonia maricola TaxID=420999 RepID=A0A2M8WNZ5_9RHOB|nr:hypothetical protein BC777_1518 [Yoonia maricola]